MTLDDLLFELLEAVSTTGESHLVDWHVVKQWPPGALKHLLKTEILTPAVRAQSIECRGCENRCFMEVVLRQGSQNQPTRAFVLCDDPEMQPQMGRINIPLEHLQQWRVTPLQLAKSVARLMDIENKAEDRVGQENIRIGMIKSKKGRRWVSLNKSPLTLEANGHQLPLEEVLYFENDMLAIDRTRIDQLIDKSPSGNKKKYTPSTEKREARKRETDAMYQDWQDEYLKLHRLHPNHSDSWIAKQIEKMEIAQGRDSETIRKQMKQ